MKQYINEIILFLTGGGLATFFNFLRDKRKDKNDEYRDLIDYMSKLVESRDAQLEKMQEQNDVCRKEIDKLKSELNELKAKFIVIESAHFDIPFPMWLKSLDGKMISLNNEYENVFLYPINKSAKDYIGKNDEEFWGLDIAKEYCKNDKKALNSKNGYWSGRETIIINGVDYSDQWTIVKFVRHSGRVPIGIGGIAIPNII